MGEKLDSESSRKVNRFEPIKHSMRMKRRRVISTSVYAQEKSSDKISFTLNIGLDKEITTSPLGNNARADDKQPDEVFLPPQTSTV
ncbi:hypothetical protein CEXT_540211 [Caerostris extrusa]|uniref:Uncharacterized protein n=1 Tax=Caerostris extrusa TaxID=172846 RepID=A0AAV4XZJ8_CAEEX|nr:hypothetical protein CEXT_540211 [Caerostris extrusa]